MKLPLRSLWYMSKQEHIHFVSGALVFGPGGAYVYSQGGWAAVWGTLGVVVVIFVVRSFVDGWRGTPAMTDPDTCPDCGAWHDGECPTTRRQRSSSEESK